MMELKKMLLFVLMRQALQTVFEKRKANEMLQVQTGDRWYYKVRSSLRETVMVVVGGNLKHCHGIRVSLLTISLPLHILQCLRTAQPVQ